MELRLKKDTIIDVLKINERISQVRDIDSLLDLVLLEARAITGADAGSIYLVKGGKLSFEYVQNDTLLAKDGDRSNKYLYQKQEIEINNRSVAGYVARNQKPLAIEDAYNIKGRVPYSFNRSFDESSSYRTQSILTVPMMIENQLVGVMQIINAGSTRGKIVPFSSDDSLLVSMLARQAADAIERAKMTREIILRMIKMAELRDPQETGPHVNRVGAYSIEIYQRWAHKNNIPEKEIKRKKDILRIAAMLHDAGKVAISDAILKKRASLDAEEFHEMKLHTVYGARLFNTTNSDWDNMAAEIALNHHEKWDGSGYPGHIKDIFAAAIDLNPGKRGEEIPLSARIVALADVYDALVSQRSYKESWSEERVAAYIEAERGSHFDPQLVDAFIEIYDVIKAIRQKYPG